MKTLYLLRHAKTDQFSKTGRDFDRCLLPKGKRQCSLMKDALLKNEVNPDIILVSTAKRTQETYELVADALHGKVMHSSDLYLCSATTLLDAINQIGDANEVMIIGHNFGISDLAVYLDNTAPTLQTCGLLKIQFNIDSWQEVSRDLGIIQFYYRPQVD